jgi:hypothetical protein
MTTTTLTNAGALMPTSARIYFRSGDDPRVETTTVPTDHLAELRALVPRRGLSPAEARRVAEFQANRLLKLAGLSEPAVPESIIDELDGIEVAYRDNWPTSGMTRQLEDGWAVFIRSREAKVRQRFTLAHEFKHILDDPFIEWLYPTVREYSPEDRAENICDYFAACLLMPKVWLRRDWTTRTQNIAALARRYRVSRQAMEVRLTQLGLLMPRPRCGGTTRQGERL